MFDLKNNLLLKFFSSNTPRDKNILPRTIFTQKYPMVNFPKLRYMGTHTHAHMHTRAHVHTHNTHTHIYVLSVAIDACTSVTSGCSDNSLR